MLDLDVDMYNLDLFGKSTGAQSVVVCRAWFAVIMLIDGVIE